MGIFDAFEEMFQTVAYGKSDKRFEQELVQAREANEFEEEADAQMMRKYVMYAALGVALLVVGVVAWKRLRQ